MSLFVCYFCCLLLLLLPVFHVLNCFFSSVMLRQSPRCGQVTGRKVSFSSQFVEVSIHSQLVPVQGSMAEGQVRGEAAQCVAGKRVTPIAPPHQASPSNTTSRHKPISRVTQYYNPVTSQSSHLWAYDTLVEHLDINHNRPHPPESKILAWDQ